MNVEIITIGNEVITGHITDTNAAFLADTVFSLGVEITRVVSVGDTAKPRDFRPYHKLPA